jgi:hypothetical protein
LNSADQPPPGFSYLNFLLWYETHTFKDPDGSTVPIDFDMDIIVDLNVLAYTPKKKFLGATYSASVAIPIVNAAITIPILGADGGGVGIGDPYFEPLSLGWALKKG